jgi:hypothetical protein
LSTGRALDINLAYDSIASTVFPANYDYPDLAAQLSNLNVFDTTTYDACILEFDPDTIGGYFIF